MVDGRRVNYGRRARYHKGSQEGAARVEYRHDGKQQLEKERLVLVPTVADQYPNAIVLRLGKISRRGEPQISSVGFWLGRI